MNHTTNLHLPQFEATDRIHHDDFNDAFAAIDAAMPRIATGTYTGDGQFGEEHSCSLTFSFEPKLVIIGLCNDAQGDIVHFIKGNTTYFCRNVGGTSGIHGTLSFQGNTVSWYSSESVFHQLNYSGWPYVYFAIG